MAMTEGARVTVNGKREIVGATLPLWCNGKSGTVLREEDGVAVVKLDGVSARELRFLPSELVPALC